MLADNDVVYHVPVLSTRVLPRALMVVRVFEESVSNCKYKTGTKLQ